MKEIIYKIRSGFVSDKWGDNDKIKVLIETNNYFKPELWNSVLNKHITNDRIDTKYFKNKYECYKLINDAQVLFSFGDNNYCNKGNIRMLYYGVSQPFKSDDSIKNVYFAKGLSSQSIAEYCLAYSLIIVNDFGKYFKNQSNKIWKQLDFNKSYNASLIDKVIGVLGLGNNGKEVSTIFKKNGCKVYGYDIKSDNANVVDVFCNSFDELLKVSDILIATVNYSERTKNIFNINTLSNMKENAFLINVSRGGIVNEDDLYKILKGQKIAGAVLDVTIDEPLSRYNKLWTLDNLIITPHISGNINKYHLEVMYDFTDKLNLFFKN